MITNRKQVLIIFGKWSLDMSLITSVPNGQLFKTRGKFINHYVCPEPGPGPEPFTFSCNRKSEQQVSLKRDFLHHTGTQKVPSVSPPSNSSGAFWQEILDQLQNASIWRTRSWLSRETWERMVVFEKQSKTRQYVGLGCVYFSSDLQCTEPWLCS